MIVAAAIASAPFRSPPPRRPLPGDLDAAAAYWTRTRRRTAQPRPSAMASARPDLGQATIPDPAKADRAR